jgi:hypothetical protein
VATRSNVKNARFGLGDSVWNKSVRVGIKLPHITMAEVDSKRCKRGNLLSSKGAIDIIVSFAVQKASLHPLYTIQSQHDATASSPRSFAFVVSQRLRVRPW